MKVWLKFYRLLSFEYCRQVNIIVFCNGKTYTQFYPKLNIFRKRQYRIFIKQAFELIYNRKYLKKIQLRFTDEYFNDSKLWTQIASLGLDCRLLETFQQDLEIRSFVEILQKFQKGITLQKQYMFQSVNPSDCQITTRIHHTEYHCIFMKSAQQLVNALSKVILAFQISRMSIIQTILLCLINYGYNNSSTEKMISIFPILALVFLPVHAGYLYMKPNLDSYPTSFYKCYKQSGINDISMLMDYNLGSDFTTFYNARNAGLSLQAILFPSCRDIQNYASQTLKLFGTETIKRFWFMPSFFPQKQFQMRSSVEQNAQNLSPQEKCLCLQSLVKSFEEKNLRSGIFTNKIAWEKNFRESCPQLGKSETLLWWIPDDEDVAKEPNFDDFIEFGGWERPVRKELSVIKYICGAQFFVSFYEGQ